MVNLRRAMDCIDRYIERHLPSTGTPGLSLALTDRDRLLQVATYGYADLAAKVRVTADTLFQIGSITKSFTSIALLQLQEAGRLDIRVPVTRYLPWFEVRSRYAPIAVEHLMSHTAAIPSGSDATPVARSEVWALREMEASAPPGTFHYYSNIGYQALGVILEDLEHLHYGDVMRRRILDPLGMAATHPVISPETRRRQAVGYVPLYDDRPAHRAQAPAVATWFETDTADGCIASTPADMAAYVRMILNRGQGPGGRIVSDESFALLTEKVIERQGGRFSGYYGRGLAIFDHDGHTVIGHRGSMVGHRAMIYADMDAGLAVVVLANGTGDPEPPARYALEVLAAACGAGEIPPPPPEPDPMRVENAGDYLGRYGAGVHGFAITAEGHELAMRWQGQRLPLESRQPDGFFVDHPAWDRFLLYLKRRGEGVVEAVHGPDWYPHERYAGPPAPDCPPEWEAYAGHYRSWNPWLTNFRVVARQGRLLQIVPDGSETVLVPLGDGSFRVGEDERLPERLRFGMVVGGKAIRAELSGGAYYRTFTP